MHDEDEAVERPQPAAIACVRDGSFRVPAACRAEGNREADHVKTSDVENQGYRIWVGFGFVSSRARKSSSHPALFNLPLTEPFDPSSFRALSAQRRSRARFCGPLSFRVRL